MKQEILRIDRVTREINGVTYLDDLNLNIFQGEILGLVPLDNNGKAQLIELIMQNVPITFGRVYFADQLVNYYEHSNLTENDVYLLNEDSKLIAELTVQDNIFVLNKSFRDFVVKERILTAQTKKLLSGLNIDLEPDQYVFELTFFQRIVVELVRAVVNGTRLVILDELSSFLSLEELALFQELVIRYSRRGISFLYISNDPEELFASCPRTVLFEKGRIIKILEAANYSKEALSLYSHPIEFRPYLNQESNKKKVVRLQAIWTRHLRDVSFSVNAGECLAILDLNNQGIHDLAQLINGLAKPKKGRLFVNGQRKKFSVNQSLLISAGIGYIPENPVQESLFLERSYLTNLTFLVDRKLGRSIVNQKVLNYIKQEFAELAGANLEAPNLLALDVESLYDLVYFRFLLFKPQAVCIMHPFANADLALRERIVELINLFKQTGIAVIVLGVNVSDITQVADRFLLLQNGKFVKSLPGLSDLQSDPTKLPTNLPHFPRNIPLL